MSDINKVISKIKKCLALSKDSNKHEAATALRQAQALMRLHNISDLDVLAAEASESSTGAGAINTPARWETMLAFVVGKAFACHTVFAKSVHRDRRRFIGEWVFIGCNSAPEIAQYAFTVLYRQLKRQRSEFTDKNLKRFRRASKIRLADLFCDGWVISVNEKVESFASTESNDKAIAAYMSKKYGEITALTSKDRSKDHQLNERDQLAYTSGRLAGRNVELHHGVAGRDDELLTHTAAGSA